jgi:phosphoribosyl-ATP pyrophosphohydrolase/phosphoribosyl-AMP cyclohydrolase
MFIFPQRKPCEKSKGVKNMEKRIIRKRVAKGKISRTAARVFEAMKDIKFDKNGLVPMIVQDANSNMVLSLFYANRKALKMTRKSGLIWRYSRTYGKLMQKGASSGNTQKVVSVARNCENNSLLMRVIPKGPACHTGMRSCFGDIL